VEAHHLTDISYRFLDNVTYDEIIALTATVPEKGSAKETLLASIAPTVFTYTLDEAIQDNISADYDIYVIEMPLDDTAKTIQGGNKKNRFYQSEKRAYEYLQRQFIQVVMSDKEDKGAIIDSIIRKRAQFLYNLPSKQKIASLVLKKILGDERTLVFGGTKKQVETLCGNNVFHSGTDDVALNKFINGLTSYLCSIRALDEGGNFPGIDQIFIIQLTGKSRQTIQRIGRALRKREGHKAKVFILVVTGTEDEEWSKKALEGFDKSKIFYVSYKNFLT